MSALADAVSRSRLSSDTLSVDHRTQQSVSERNEKSRERVCLSLGFCYRRSAVLRRIFCAGKSVSSAALLGVMQGRDTKPGAEETSKTVLRKFPRKSNNSTVMTKQYIRMPDDFDI